MNPEYAMSVVFGFYPLTTGDALTRRRLMRNKSQLVRNFYIKTGKNNASRRFTSGYVVFPR
jgi:hypothetical protein